MTGLGYRQIGQHLRGEISLDEAVALIKRQTRRFVHQQYNWFRLDDPAIDWVNLADTPMDEVLARIPALYLAESRD
jgi:tRNA dimethylallyltransferase